MLFIQIENDLPVGYPISADNLKYVFPNLNLEEEVPPGYAKFISGDRWNKQQEVGENQTLEGGEYKWDEDHNNIVEEFTIRDLTPEEIARKVEVANLSDKYARFNQPIET